jgi:hypothetical protein
MTITAIDTEAVFQAYVECALWSSNDESDESGGRPMDENYGPDDIAPDTLDAMRADVTDFLAGADADALAFWVAEHGAAQVGHDFWLTRNHHGAGFWDRWSGGTRGYAYGELLTAQAKPYGESDLYVGDDGLVYVA